MQSFIDFWSRTIFLFTSKKISSSNFPPRKYAKKLKMVVVHVYFRSQEKDCCSSLCGKMVYLYVFLRAITGFRTGVHQNRSKTSPWTKRHFQLFRIFGGRKLEVKRKIVRNEKSIKLCWTLYLLVIYVFCIVFCKIHICSRVNKVLLETPKYAKKLKMASFSHTGAKTGSDT